jgi:hypothetical protein
VGVVDFALDGNLSSPALPIKAIKRVKFYWGSTSDGVPTPLFGFKDQSTAPHTASGADSVNVSDASVLPSESDKKYWPYDGIAIVKIGAHPLDSSPTDVFVIGQVVSPLPSSSFLGADLLSFSISHSLGYLISNPYDSPDLWEYRPITLPHAIIDRQTKQPSVYLNWLFPSSLSSL